MAAWTDEINFESPTYSTGSIGGQDGWSSTATNWQITTANPYSGSQNARATISGNVGANNRSITTVSDDNSIVYISLSKDNITSSDNAFVRFLDSGTANIGSLYIGGLASNGIYYRVSGGTWNLITTISAGTYYRIGIEFDFTNNRCRCNVNNGAFGSWINWTASHSNIDSITLQANNGDGTNTVVDIDNMFELKEEDN